MKRYVGLALLCSLSCALPLWADTLSNARPTANGGSNQWTNNSGTSCGTDANCFTQVNESSGVNCTTTPGDTTVNKSTATINQIQRYDINESSIPDNSTVTSITVYVCAVRGGSQNAGGELRVAHNSSETVCASTFTSTSTYTDFNCAITVSFTKTSSSDIEIGVKNTQARDLWIAAIKADVTYTPPAGGPRRTIIAKLKPRTSGR